MDNLLMQKKDYSRHTETAKSLSDRQKEMLKGIFFLGIATVALMASHDWITHCDYFRIQDIVIIGGQRVSREEVLLYAGIREGMNLADLNLSVARKRLLSNPWIAAARMEAVFPSSVRIQIEEHQPIAVFDMERRFAVNQKGHIFREMKAGESLEFPTVRGLKFADIAARDAGESFKAVMDVLQYSQQRDSILPNPVIQEIRAERETGLTLILSDSFPPVPVKEIRMGFGDYPLKYRQLRKLFAYLKENSRMQKIEFIDLNNPDRIVVSPGTTQSPGGENKEV